ncbi:oligosaccharide repeat unit polymerase [compost metagenome]
MMRAESTPRAHSYIFSPVLLMLLLWVPQIVVHYFWAEAFDPFALSTWTAVVVGLTAFLAGAAAACLPIYAGEVDKEFSTRWALRPFMWIFPATILLVAYWMIQAAGTTNPVAIRQAIIWAKFDGSGTFDQPIKVLLAGIAFCLYFLCDAHRMTRRQLWTLVTLGVIAAVLTTGRLQLLLFVIAAAAILSRRGIFRGVHLAGAGIVFVALFFGIAVVLGKGLEGTETLVEQIAWNLRVYVFGSLSCFNDYMVNGYGGQLGPMMVPNFLREWMGILPREPVNPFVQVPFYCNTYTALFPIMHDFGWLGLVLMFSGLGFMHQRLFTHYVAVGSTARIYLFALSLYPMAMMIFEDAYFSSYGMWAILWLPLVFHVSAAVHVAVPERTPV